MTPPFVILGCGAEKRSLASGTSCPAVDLYTGPLYRDRLAYARALGGPHLILSGMHGVISPDEPLDAYNFDLSKCERDVRQAWIEAAERALRRRVPPDGPVVALCSGVYRAPLHWLGDRVVVPAKGLGVGGQRAELRRLTRDLDPAEKTVAEELAWLDRELAAIPDDVEVTLTAAAFRAALARRVA